MLALGACGGRAAPSNTALLARLPAVDASAMEPAVAALLAERRAALGAAPRDAARWHALGAALDAHMLLPEAEACLAVAVELDPRGFEPAYEYAFLGALLGRAPAVVRARYDAALALRPDYAAAHLRRGEAALDAGFADEARASFERALALDPGYDRAQLALARALLALERAREAVDALRPLHARHPDSREVVGVFARALLSVGDVVGAEPLTARLAELAEVPLPVNDPARAAVLAQTVTIAARSERARRAAARGDLVGATRELEAVVAALPGRASFALELAQLYIQGRRSPDAARLLEAMLPRLTEGAPEAAAVLALLGQLDVEAGRFELGLERLERAARTRPPDLAARHARGSALGSLGRWSEAAGQFLEAAASAENPAEYRLLAGLSLCEAGRFDEARVELEVGRALAPEHPLARTLAARLEAR